MHIIISCAKTMQEPENTPVSKEIMDISTLPEFQSQADMIASDMASYDPAQLADILHINLRIANQNYRRYRNFPDPLTRRPAALLYDGIVFKKMELDHLESLQLEAINPRLSICSFLYGLLRPLDLINPYRLEGKVELPSCGNGNLFHYWQPILTDALIARVNKCGGTLINLAAAEMKGMFDWKRICSEVKVITPDFKELRDGKPKSVTIYAKICRGAMARHILTNAITDPAQLADWEYDGFRLHDPSTMLFLRQ